MTFVQVRGPIYSESKNGDFISSLFSEPFILLVVCHIAFLEIQPNEALYKQNRPLKWFIIIRKLMEMLQSWTVKLSNITTQGRLPRLKKIQIRFKVLALISTKQKRKSLSNCELFSFCLSQSFKTSEVRRQKKRLVEEICLVSGIVINNRQEPEIS